MDGNCDSTGPPGPAQEIEALVEELFARPKSIQPVSGVTRETSGPAWKFTCAKCFVHVGPGQPEQEIYLEVPTGKWVCGFHPRWDMHLVDDYVKIAWRDEVEALSPFELNRLLRERTQQLSEVNA